jgi:hypothetical protein
MNIKEDKSNHSMESITDDADYEIPICQGCNISHHKYCREGQPKPYVDCPDECRISRQALPIDYDIRVTNVHREHPDEKGCE